MNLLVLAALCALAESVMTALEVAASATSKARIRDIIEDAHDNARVLAAGREVDEEISPRTLRRAQRLLPLLEQREKLSLMFLIATTLLMWCAATALWWHAQQHDWPVWGLPLALVLLLFIAEVLPLLLAAPRPENVALFGSRLCGFLLRVLSPLVFVLGSAGRALAWMMGARHDATAHVTTDELRTALAAAEEEGVIESEERAMLEGAMNFREIRVREVMTPRIDMIAVEAQTPLPRVLEIALEAGHSRLPVFEERLDKIAGIIAVKDLLPHLRADTQRVAATAGEVVRPVFFVPQEKMIAAALEDLRRERSLMAIVVDENGGTAGLVTLEDLLEELVGEIEDEHDDEDAVMQVESNTASEGGTTEDGGETVNGDVLSTQEKRGAAMRWESALRCDSGVSVREMKRFWQRAFGSKISILAREQGGSETEALTLAALAQQLFDRVPQPLDCVAAGEVQPESGGQSEWLHLQIIEMDGPRIESVRFFATPAPEHRL